MTRSDPTQDLDYSLEEQIWISFTSLTVLILAVVVNFCFIWYENTVSDLYRTLVNKMIAVLALHNILMTAITSAFVFAIVVLDMRNGLFCNVGLTFGMASFVAILLVLDEIMLLRFAYAIVFSNVGQLNEDFFGCFSLC